MGDMCLPRWEQRGRRPAKIANCSGAKTDLGLHMRRQAELGDVDFITGDYLAEVNLPEHKQAMLKGKHDGWEPTCWDGIEQTLDLLVDRDIKLIVNGGALNPAGLARKTQELIKEKQYQFAVAYVSGDDLTEEIQAMVAKGQLPPHLDSSNPEVKTNKMADPLTGPNPRPVITAHAYLGARGIMAALENGADIVITGRVSDASPVIAAAWYWHRWEETDYDRLAGALVAGHLIECSAYATGANFAGFDEYDLETFLDLPFGIAEVDQDGSAIITKHPNTNGIVTADVIRCQFLYELQGAIYLNSDVSADVSHVVIQDVGKDRVRMAGVKGYPPPPTTKLAVFYHAGFNTQFLVNAVGYGTDKKWQLFEMQMRRALKEAGVLDQFDELEFQIVGTPEPNPRSQLQSTTYCRLFAQSVEAGPVSAILPAFGTFAMQHFHGLHYALDFRTAIPKPFIAFYPGLYDQSLIKEAAHLLSRDGSVLRTIPAKAPTEFRELERRFNHEAEPYLLANPNGPVETVLLGDIALGRSGDKGGNINVGMFPKNPAQWMWFRSYMTSAKMQELIGDDWKDEYVIERMEFVQIRSVHFVIYGILGRGVLGNTLLDGFGKGFVDYIRDKEIDVPIEILDLPYQSWYSKL